MYKMHVLEHKVRKIKMAPIMKGRSALESLRGKNSGENTGRAWKVGNERERKP